MSRGASLARVGLAYVIAFGVASAWLARGPDTRWLWLDGLIADLLATLVVFVASRIHHNSSFYDAYWSVVPPLVFLYWWGFGPLGIDDARSWLVIVVMGLWSVRLTLNWARSWPGLHHEDWRYEQLRSRAGRAGIVVDLVAIHVVPTLQVFLATVPLYLATRRDARPLGPLDVVAVVVGLGSVLLEATADRQMRRFARDRRPGEAMDRGLWSWSRHPNYLGEFGFWVAMGLFGFAAAPAHVWWVFAGALAMLAMFEAASIPMMEARSLERRPDYQQVVERVSRFWPRPPRRTA